MARTLSPQANKFLREGVRSLLELDVLLLLHRDDNRWWSAEQLVQELRVRPEAAGSTLETLAARNLLDVRIGSTLTYRFAPVELPLRVTVGEIATDPYAARELMMGADIATAARRFADAFKLRKTDG